MPKTVAIIGSGFSGLAAASVLAKKGFSVTVFEKNEQSGGRCRKWESEGFTFDMGPSWYWMPDIFESFYQLFGKTTSDFYKLIRLDPSYKVFFEDESINIPADYNDFGDLIEKIEPNSKENLNKFLKEAQYKYEVGIGDMVRKPSLSWWEFVDSRILKSVFRLQLIGSFSTHIRKYFTNPKIIKLIEFPVLFLGAKPKDTPALYSLMNYADIKLGTWYPMKGMIGVAAAFEKIASLQGVKILFNSNVKKIEVENNLIANILVNNEKHSFDYVISSADYQHTDQKLLGLKNASYSKKYWDSRKLSPSCLLYFIGTNKKIQNLEHHNLFFDTDYEKHSNEIYDTPKFPSDPLFYVCCPSKTDDSVAPANGENLFILIPVAPDLDDTKDIQEKYLDICIKRIENRTETSIRNSIIVQRNFGINDFKMEYNSFKGNAYGMASTLLQTAVLKPKIKHKKIKNMFFCGQLTVPGPGVPPSIISGEIVANYIIKKEKKL